MSLTTIGWFGVPGSRREGGLTHLVCQTDHKPLCGTRFSPKAEYQWCYPHWKSGEPECERCKKIKMGMWLSAANRASINAMKPKPNTNVKVHFSSDSNEWATPQPLFDWLDDQYHFNLDPCCTKATAKCKNYFTIADNGLKQPWAKHGSVFMNPPYGREIVQWMKKAYEESLEGATVVCLVPARTDTKWWEDYCLQADNILFLIGRVKFIENGVALKAGAPFPSAIITFLPPAVKNTFRCWWRPIKQILAR